MIVASIAVRAFIDQFYGDGNVRISLWNRLPGGRRIARISNMEVNLLAFDYLNNSIMVWNPDSFGNVRTFRLISEDEWRFEEILTDKRMTEEKTPTPVM